MHAAGHRSIVIVGPTHPYKGGVAQHTTELARHLAAAGDSVRIESWSAQYPDRLYPGQQRVTAPEVPLHDDVAYPLSWRRPDTWWRLGRRLRRHPADAVVVVLVTPLQIPAYLVILRALIGLRRRRPLPAAGGGGPARLVICHNVLPHEPRPGDTALTRALLRRSTGVLVHSSAESRTATALLGGATDPPVVAVAPLPPHLPGAVPARSSGPRPVLRRLAFFGMVRPYKGLDVLLRALAKGPPDVELLVAGEFWGGVEPYERLVVDLGLSGRVELRDGYVPADAVAGLLARADALVMPYRSATASQNVQLALAHGLVPVVSRVGALADGVRDEQNGLVVEPEDVDGLAAALCRLYEGGMLDELRARRSDGATPATTDSAWNDYLAALEGLLTVQS